MKKDTKFLIEIGREKVGFNTFVGLLYRSDMTFLADQNHFVVHFIKVT